MKHLLRLVLITWSVIGIAKLVSFTQSNEALRNEIAQLEAELGRMSIEDEDKVYLVAIESPRIPPEVAPHVDRVWQFRCYLPPGYDFQRMNGGGRVSAKGLYFQGGYSSSYGSPQKESSHELLTISLRQDENHVECCVSFGGSGGTSSWNHLGDKEFDLDTLVVETLAIPGEPAQSFDQDTILPVLRVYNPETAEEKDVNGEKISTLQGGIFVLCPKSLSDEFDQLRKGERPIDFEDSWIAQGRQQ